MKEFLRLIRFSNLIIIGLTMCAMRYLIINPFLGINMFKLQLPELHFFMLVLSVVCMAAAGYAINDYFDIKADRFNHRKIIVGRTITRRTTLFLHTMFNVISVLLAGYVSYRIGYWEFTFIFVMASGLLWFYSTSYKHYFLIGNILIAFLTAAIPFLVIVYEIPMLNRAYAEILLATETNFNYMIYWVGAFSFFAFISILIGRFLREMRSVDGDRENNRRSLPLVFGMKITKIVVVSLVVLLIVVLVALWYRYLNFSDDISIWYFSVFIILPLIWMGISVVRSKTLKDIKLCELLLKWIVLAGISYSFVVYYITANIG